MSAPRDPHSSAWFNDALDELRSGIAPLQQALLDRIRLMGFDHAIGLDSARQRDDAYAAQMTRDRSEATTPNGNNCESESLAAQREQGANRTRQEWTPALNQRVRGSKPRRRTSTGALLARHNLQSAARAVLDATSADPAGPHAAGGTTVHEPAGAARRTEASGWPGGPEPASATRTSVPSPS
jgi:hypothetical protein